MDSHKPSQSSIEWVSSLHWEDKGTIDETKALKAKDKGSIDEAEAKETDESDGRTLERNDTLNNDSQQQHSIGDDTNKFSSQAHSVQTTSRLQPLGHHETEESDRKSNGTLKNNVSHEQHSARDDADKFSSEAHTSNNSTVTKQAPSQQLQSETETTATKNNSRRNLKKSTTLPQEQYSSRDDADKFSHFVRASTPPVPLSNQETDEILRSAVSQDHYFARDDAENLSQVQFVQGSSPIIVQQPLSPHFSHEKSSSSWQDDRSRRVVFDAPPYSNRVHPATDYVSPTTEYVPPPTRDYARPATRDYVRPATRDYVRPATRDYTRPATRDYTRPATRDFLRPATRDGALELIDSARPFDLRSLRSSKVAPAGSSRANDHLHFSVVLMFTCFICFIPSGGLTLVGALCLLPALICAAVGADYNKEGKLKEARSLGLAALICSAVTIILTAIFIVLGVIGGIVALQLLVLANN